MSYNTKQKQIILDYLKDNNDKCLTMKDIYEGVKNNKIGVTTIYRYLNKLYEDGKINKFLNDNMEASYQYILNDECINHIHLKCQKCGKIIHLDCHIINDFKNHVDLEHDFSIDNSKTTIYGLCKGCRNEKIK